MQKLETELTYQGRTLRQLERRGLVAIYELRNDGNMLLGFEVIRIKVRPAEEAFGKSYPEREVYPAREEFGRLAWSFGTGQRKTALAMFNGLAKRPSKGAPRAVLTTGR